METRAWALDEQAERDVEFDAEELREAALDYNSGDELDGLEDGDEDAEGADGVDEGFILQTTEEREAERKSGAQDLVVRHGMRQCVRILSNFKRLAAKGRCVHSAQLF